MVNFAKTGGWNLDQAKHVVAIGNYSGLFRGTPPAKWRGLQTSLFYRLFKGLVGFAVIKVIYTTESISVNV